MTFEEVKSSCGTVFTSLADDYWFCATVPGIGGVPKREFFSSYPEHN